MDALLTPPEKSVEIRINSVQDAKSLVFNMKKVMDFARVNSLKSVEYLIAEHIVAQVQPIIAGACPLKVYQKVVSTRNGQPLFVLPPFIEATPRIYQEPPARIPITTVKKRGRRKGSKNKPKMVSDPKPELVAA